VPKQHISVFEQSPIDASIYRGAAVIGRSNFGTLQRVGSIKKSHHA